MEREQIKRFFGHPHMPDRHATAIKLQHMVHDERFWALLAIAIIMTVLITIGVWATIYGESNPQDLPINPFPYSF